MTLWDELLKYPNRDIIEDEDVRVIEFLAKLGLDHQTVVDQFKERERGFALTTFYEHPSHACIMLYAKHPKDGETGYTIVCMAKSQYAPAEVLVKVGQMALFFADKCNEPPTVATVSLGGASNRN